MAVGRERIGPKTDVNVRLRVGADADSSASRPPSTIRREFRSAAEEPLRRARCAGSVRFEKAVRVGAGAAGMLRADFTTRVLSGGASASATRRVAGPYNRFVGVRAEG
jgi:hypothetical protein